MLDENGVKEKRSTESEIRSENELKEREEGDERGEKAKKEEGKIKYGGYGGGIDIC